MTKKKKNEVLHEHELLTRIQAIRERLGNTDRTDHVDKTFEWEARAKKSLIFLNLKGHEGIQMILDKAKEEISIRNNNIRTRRPEGFSPEQTAKYAGDNAFDFAALDMWMWFLALFVDAETSVKELEALLNYEESPVDDDYLGQSE